MFITIGIKIPENEFLEQKTVRSHSNYNLIENKVGHHDFLGYVPLCPHSMLEFQVKMQGNTMKLCHEMTLTHQHRRECGCFRVSFILQLIVAYRLFVTVQISTV